MFITFLVQYMLKATVRILPDTFCQTKQLHYTNTQFIITEGMLLCCNGITQRKGYLKKSHQICRATRKTFDYV